MTVPVTQYDPRRAADAFEVYSIIKQAERDHPSLKKNPEWTITRQDAFERFALAFEGNL